MQLEQAELLPRGTPYSQPAEIGQKVYKPQSGSSNGTGGVGRKNSQLRDNGKSIVH